MELKNNFVTANMAKDMVNNFALNHTSGELEKINNLIIERAEKGHCQLVIEDFKIDDNDRKNLVTRGFGVYVSYNTEKVTNVVGEKVLKDKHTTFIDW